MTHQARHFPLFYKFPLLHPYASIIPSLNWEQALPLQAAFFATLLLFQSVSLNLSFYSVVTEDAVVFISAHL